MSERPDDRPAATPAGRSLAFSPDGSRVITGGTDALARLWDARTGVEVMALKGHTNALQAVGFSPDGSCVVTGSLDGAVRLWVVRSAKP